MSIGTPDLQLTHQASSVISVGQPTNNKFFIIKSYTEEDVHKAVKYGIWSSTAAGNKVLDAAFCELEEFKKENADQEADVYLFFSVNKSKHFCGVAKMVSRVNHNKNHSDLWRQSKWPGSILL